MILVPILLMGGGIATLYVLLTAGCGRPRARSSARHSGPAAGFDRLQARGCHPGRAAEGRHGFGHPAGAYRRLDRQGVGRKLAETTKLDERGYFQLMPAESESLGLDHDRLSTDEVYSINAGLLLIAKYMKAVQALGIAPVGSSFSGN